MLPARTRVCSPSFLSVYPELLSSCRAQSNCCRINTVSVVSKTACYAVQRPRQVPSHRCLRVVRIKHSVFTDTVRVQGLPGQRRLPKAPTDERLCLKRRCNGRIPPRHSWLLRPLPQRPKPARYVEADLALSARGMRPQPAAPGPPRSHAPLRQGHVRQLRRALLRQRGASL